MFRLATGLLIGLGMLVLANQGGSADLLTNAMVWRLQPERAALPQEIGIGIGGLHITHLSGSKSGPLELQRSAAEFQPRPRTCRDERDQARAITARTTKQASAEISSGESAGVAAPSNVVAARAQSQQIWSWSCSEYLTPREQTERPRRRARQPGSSGQPSRTASVSRERRGGSSSGGGAVYARAAASSVPTP